MDFKFRKSEIQAVSHSKNYNKVSTKILRIQINNP